jgi:hypothetical protein
VTDLRSLIKRGAVWAVPVAVFFLTRREQSHVKTGIEAILGIGVLVLVARRPYKSAMILLTVLPFEMTLFPLLLRLGIPSTVLRGLGFYKEAIAAGLAIAAFRRARAVGTRFDAIDKVAAAYVLLGCLYLALPGLVVGGQVGAHLSFYARELGWRSDIMYVGLFLVFRHLGLGRHEVVAIFRRVLSIAFIIAAIGIYEFARPSSFNHFLVKVLQVPEYQTRVLHSVVLNPNNLLAFASPGSHLVRVGSILINYLEPGWYFVIGLAIAIELITRGQSRPWIVISVPVIGIALIFTQSRAAIIAGIVVLVYSLRARIGRSVTGRVRLSSFLVLAALVGIPVIVLFGLGHRFVGSQHSNTDHVKRVQAGLHAIGRSPLGRGLATSEGGGSTAAGKGLVSQTAILDPEDQWLLIGIQLGVFGLALYALALILMLRGLRARAPNHGLSEAAIPAEAMRSAFLGILVASFVLPIFTEPVISWTVFGMCGLAVGVQDRVSEDLGALQGSLTRATGKFQVSSMRLLAGTSGPSRQH